MHSLSRHWIPCIFPHFGTAWCGIGCSCKFDPSACRDRGSLASCDGHFEESSNSNCLDRMLGASFLWTKGALIILNVSERKDRIVQAQRQKLNGGREPLVSALLLESRDSLQTMSKSIDFPLRLVSMLTLHASQVHLESLCARIDVLPLYLEPITCLYRVPIPAQLWTACRTTIEA